MRWKRAASSAFVLVAPWLAALAQPAAPLTPSRFELSFWATSNTTGDPRLVALHAPASCPTPIAIARVARMPPADDPALVTDPAQELGPEGTVLGSWRLPANAVVVGLNGDRLQLPLPYLGGRPALLAIHRDGSLALAGEFDPAQAAAQASPAACPSGSRVPEHWRCWRLRDAASGRERLIAYPRPCA